jgi:hypothetical protein
MADAHVRVVGKQARMQAACALPPSMQGRVTSVTSKALNVTPAARPARTTYLHHMTPALVNGHVLCAQGLQVTLAVHAVPSSRYSLLVPSTIAAKRPDSNHIVQSVNGVGSAGQCWPPEEAHFGTDPAHKPTDAKAPWHPELHRTSEVEQKTGGAHERGWGG